MDCLYFSNEKLNYSTNLSVYISNCINTKGLPEKKKKTEKY